MDFSKETILVIPEVRRTKTHSSTTTESLPFLMIILTARYSIAFLEKPEFECVYATQTDCFTQLDIWMYLCTVFWRRMIEGQG